MMMGVRVWRRISRASIRPSAPGNMMSNTTRSTLLRLNCSRMLGPSLAQCTS
jgi:hypothetical protein